MMETKAKTRVYVRWSIRRDIPEILAIENASFTNPWSEEEFLRTLRQRNTIGMVAECNDKVHGYMIYELHRNRIVVLNFAVDPKSRRMGIGRQMVAKLRSKLNPSRRTKLELLARETELSGLNFFKSQDFKATELIRGHYDDSSEDAIRMEFVLPSEDCVSDEKPHQPVNRVFRHANGEIPEW